MRIFMLTPYLPYPLLSGGQVRTYNLLKKIAQEHEVTLFALIKDESERQHIPELEKYCKQVRVFKRTQKPWHPRNILLAGFTLYPFVVTRNLVMSVKKEISQEIKKNQYDLIHVETFYMMPSIPKTKIPIILVEQTIEYLGYEKFAQKITKRFPVFKPVLQLDISKIKFWEKHYWKTCDRLVTVSDDDRQFIKQVEPEVRDIEVVSNGIDLDFFKAGAGKRAVKPTILFVGTFHWLPNVEAVEFLVKKVWPQIKKAVPNVQLRIVGSSPTKEIAGYGREDKQIVVTGMVEDIRSEYSSAWALLAPVFSGKGTRYKVLEAMASQTPVVGTSIALEGINAEADVHFAQADDADSMAKETIKLLKNAKLRQQYGKKGCDLVKKKFSWDEIAQDLLDVYEKTKK